MALYQLSEKVTMQIVGNQGHRSSFLPQMYFVCPDGQDILALKSDDQWCGGCHLSVLRPYSC